MNLYLLLAIAFGAITGTAEAPVARPAMAGVVARRESRAARRVVRALRGTSLRVRLRAAVSRVVTRALASIESPLTGAATPRAPAAIG